MKNIVPCLWFDDNAEEAVNFYTSIFKDSSIDTIARHSEDITGTPGKVMAVPFRINGQDYLALNGGPMFHFTEAVSFIVNCDTQEEIDEYWAKLTEGGEESQCGWLKDKFGLSWQIVPSNIARFMQSGDARSGRVMQELLKMRKIDMNVLNEAYEG